MEAKAQGVQKYRDNNTEFKNGGSDIEQAKNLNRQDNRKTIDNQAYRETESKGK